MQYKESGNKANQKTRLQNNSYHHYSPIKCAILKMACVCLSVNWKYLLLLWNKMIFVLSPFSYVILHGFNNATYCIRKYSQITSFYWFFFFLRVLFNFSCRHNSMRTSHLLISTDIRLRLGFKTEYKTRERISIIWLRRIPKQNTAKNKTKQNNYIHWKE